MTKEYTSRVTKITIAPIDEPLFSEMATTIEIVSEGAGEFVQVNQSGRIGAGTVSIDPVEWPALRDAINSMIDDCGEDK